MSTGALCTIISGTPGAGKTALAVAMLVAERERNPARPVFVMGIPDLAVPHEPVPPVEEWTRERAHPDDPSIVYPEFVFPDGALIIIDEAQNAFRPRSQGSKVPPHVAAMERHRHKGLDFWLITQHPTMIDLNIRKLVGKHLHVRSSWAGGQLLEWSEAADPNSSADRAKAVSVRYKPDKKVFGLYKSSSMHVKRKRRIPIALYVFLAVVAVAAVLAWRVYGRVSDAIAGKGYGTSGQEVARPVGGSGAAAGASGGVVGSALTMGSFEPRLRGRLESAPLYDSTRQVVALPVVVGCMDKGSRCSCYTEQGSDAGYSVEECRAWLRSPPFSPFRSVYPAAPSDQARPAESAASTAS